MRRGGRMVYGIDATAPNSPTLKWTLGCPNLSNDSGCSTGMTEVGQTWSLPNVAFIKGYSTATPVIIMGGGYDSCEDTDSASPGCSSAKGRLVYVINADTGAVIKSFSTARGVVADISLVDTDFDGYVDYAYAADTGGNIYRIDFAAYSGGVYSSLASGAWTSSKVAYTNGSGRKFLFGPALLPTTGQVYVALGSGDREHPLSTNYPFASVTNRFYVYLDDLTANSANNLDDATTFSDFTSTTSCSSSKVLPGGGKKGWFMNLNQYGTGEQTVTSAVIVSGLITFSTNRPLPSASSCSTLLGEARGYFVNLLNASGAIGDTSSNCGLSRSSTFAGGGLPPSPVVGTVTIDGKPQTVLIGAADKEGGASSPIGGQKAPTLISPKRQKIYWYSNGDK